MSKILTSFKVEKCLTVDFVVIQVTDIIETSLTSGAMPEDLFL